MDSFADADSILAVVQFRKSVEQLKLVSNGLSDMDLIMNSTGEVFVKCDETLKKTFAENEKCEKVEVELKKMQASLNDNAGEFSKISEAILAIADIENYTATLKEIEGHFAEKDFYRLVVKIENLRASLIENPYRNAKVFTGIQMQVNKWIAVSSNWLGACIDQCITLTTGGDSISLSVDQKCLKNLCKDASIDLLVKVFSLFGRQLLSGLIVPILRRSVCSMNVSNSDVLVVNLCNEDLTDCPDKIDADFESTILNVIPSIISTFKFLKEHVFSTLKSRKFYYDIIARFGSELVGDMSSMLCSIFLRPLLPTRPSKLGSFNLLIDQVQKLQCYLEEAGFQAETNKTLNDFAVSHVTIVLDKYESTLLVQARDLMLLDWEELCTVSHSVSLKSTEIPMKLPSRLSQDSLNETIFRGSDQGLSSLPTCKVSSLMVKYFDMIRNVLDEIKSLVGRKETVGEAWLNEVLRALVSCARHVADMFLAFLPGAGDNMKCSNLMASSIILCNCSYYTNALLSLELEFASLKKLTQSTSLVQYLFIDMIQPAREHGWEKFHEAIAAYKSQILEVDLEAWCQGAAGKLMATGFRSRCEQSLNLVISKLSHVCSILRSVLPRPLALAALGILIDAVLKNIVIQLISRVDITDAESRVHFEMLNRLSDDLIENVGVAAASEDAEHPSSVVLGKVCLSKLCPESWSRFLDMISLLDSDLTTILNRWADGAGPLGTSFSAEELRKIIRALFSNSEHRQKALDSIK